MSTSFGRGVMTITAMFFVLCCAGQVAAFELPEQWTGDDVELSKGRVGDFQGGTMRYEVRTKYATLTSSDAHVMLVWNDKWAKETVHQVLFEEERYARGDQYTFNLIGKLASVEVIYPCPEDRNDRQTTCTELWEWQKNTRRFTLKKKTSTNPVKEKIEAIETYLEKGQVKKAKAALDKLEKDTKKEDLDRDKLFEMFWAQTLDRALKQGSKNPEKGVKILKEFLSDPPLRGSSRCPDKELITVCLEEGALECGCSNAFGQVSGFEGRWPKRYHKLAKMLGKAKGADDLVHVLLVPALDRVPQDSEIMLVVADMYWNKDMKFKAKPLYKKVRKIRLEDKTYIPNHVFERFK